MQSQHRPLGSSEPRSELPLKAFSPPECSAGLGFLTPYFCSILVANITMKIFPTAAHTICSSYHERAVRSFCFVKHDSESTSKVCRDLNWFWISQEVLQMLLKNLFVLRKTKQNKATLIYCCFNQRARYNFPKLQCKKWTMVCKSEPSQPSL